MSQEAAAPDLTDPRVARREKLAAIAALGLDPWGGRLDDHTQFAAVRARSSEVVYAVGGQRVELPDFDAPRASDQPPIDFRAWKAERDAAGGGERGELQGPTLRVAGRIVLLRTAGKLVFITLRDQTGELQLMIGKAQVGDSWALVDQLDLGDLIGADGQLTRTNTGELTIAAERLHFLSKSLDPPPEKHHGLTDPEQRQRQRHVDLAYNDGVMQRFLARSAIVRSIRETLHERRFVEVEGPTLHTIAGGAAARPFRTHHNTLGLDLNLRIALELHLKRLLVGGIERVYELGRVYRNEGVSPRHNPEFTMLEAYQAYGDYRSMMDLTEAVIVGAIGASAECRANAEGGLRNAQSAGGSPYVLAWGDKTIDFTPPFQRRTYDDLFAEHAGCDPTDPAAIAEVAKRCGVALRDESGAERHPDVIKSDVFEAKVEDALVGPIFVTDYPASICPLTKRKRNNPAVAERFELFVHGMELANAYTELNDPELQEQLFRQQLAGQGEEDSMAKMDDDFIRALRNAMPPAGGLGIGIDRLVMLLTNSTSIRDVILFPLLRPEK
ncbi:MAG: lysine--tRNA ligase [Lacipirellulaceae bacterium]